MFKVTFNERKFTSVVFCSGKFEGGTLVWDDDKAVDHNLERVKNEAMDDMSDEGSMSSDDEDFNPDNLEALSAKEEYDSGIDSSCFNFMHYLLVA